MKQVRDTHSPESSAREAKFTANPGDIFRDKDPRMSGRHLKVMAADCRFAYVVNCEADGANGTGRKTRISLRGLETRFVKVGGSHQQIDLERAVIEAAKAWREAERNYEASGDGDDYIHFTEAYAALRAAVDKVKG